MSTKRTVILAFEAAVNGVLFALIYWGLTSILGAPSWTHHHNTDYMFAVGSFFAIGLFTGWRQRDKDAA